MPYLIKTSDVVECDGPELMLRERPILGGRDIQPGDEVFVWSTGKAGQLIAMGRAERVESSAGEISTYLQNVCWRVLEPLQTSDLISYRESTDEEPLGELSRLLYRHSHTKITSISNGTADYMRKRFNIDNLGKIGKDKLIYEQYEPNFDKSQQVKINFGGIIISVFLFSIIFVWALSLFMHRAEPPQIALTPSQAPTATMPPVPNTPASADSSVPSTEPNAPPKWDEQDATDACGEVYAGDTSDQKRCSSMLMAQHPSDSSTTSQ